MGKHFAHNAHVLNIHKFCHGRRFATPIPALDSFFAFCRPPQIQGQLEERAPIIPRPFTIPPKHGYVGRVFCHRRLPGTAFLCAFRIDSTDLLNLFYSPNTTVLNIKCRFVGKQMACSSIVTFVFLAKFVALLTRCHVTLFAGMSVLQVICVIAPTVCASSGF